MRWVTTQDLVQWAGTLDCESRLPELLGRLVHATVSVERSSFPSGESIQTPGWDGIVQTMAAREYVPAGTSGWELSRRADIRTKADDDFEKRTFDPLHLMPATTTLVFVTPRRWNAKEDWVAEKSALGGWAEVRAYDADDLEAWLEGAPAVGAWLAHALRRYPDGVLSVDDYWAEYAAATNPRFTPGIVLAGRDQETTAVATWLDTGAGTVNIVADSPREALEFVAACLTTLSVTVQDRIRSRFLLAEDASILRELLTTGSELTIGWLAADTARVGLALQRGHRVILPARLPPTRQAEGITLSRPAHDVLSIALESAGIRAEQATALLRDSARSITVLHRRLSIAPVTPAWATPDHARELVPAVLASTWDEAHSEDTLVPASFAGTAYPQVAAQLTAWANATTDAPVQHAGSVWLVRAPRDAWDLLNPYLTRHDLEGFRERTVGVLCMPDPSLELPLEERYLAAIHNKVFVHSSWLRQGLAQTLALLSITPTVAGSRGADLAMVIVYDILQNGWERWYALGTVLPWIAEAAPSTFLTALEQQLDRDAAGMQELFASHGPMQGDHSAGLLWALELLAWYPEHLTRTVLLLARFAREHKRPRDLLRAIFLTWMPQTGADIAQRTVTLSVLLEREPTVAWDLLLALWPKGFDSGAKHYEPRYRDKPPTRPATERGPAALAIVELALTAAGTDSERLAGLIEHLGAAPAAARARVRQTLHTFSRDEQDLARRLVVWDALRDEVNKHRSFATARWAMPEPELAVFDPIITALTPARPADCFRWLFGKDHPHLPIPHDDFAAFDAALATEREQAIRAIIAADGAAGIKEFAMTVDLPFLVGRVIATAAGTEHEDVLLGLLAEEHRLTACGMGYAAERYATEGTAWVDRVLATHHEWTPETRVRFLHALPSICPIWQRVETQGVVEEFWRRTRVVLMPQIAEKDLTYAVEHLLAHSQVPQALDEASMLAKRMTTPVLTQTLDGVLQAIQQPEPKFDHLIGYHILQILGELDTRADVDVGTIARFEWALLPLLRNERQLRLYEYLSNEPTFFAQMIASVYRPENSQASPDPSAEEAARAHHAYDLLSSWHTLPGTRANGTIDAQSLQAWINAAQAACTEHREICDHHIGQVLAYAPNGTDGVWPHESIRAVLENANSQAMESGFRNGTLNKRGIVTRDPFDGGQQELTIAQRYRMWAHALASANPRTAAVLAEIAEDYERDAHRQDIDAAHLRLRY